jgi:hypothetical protein
MLLVPHALGGIAARNPEALSALRGLAGVAPSTLGTAGPMVAGQAVFGLVQAGDSEGLLACVQAARSGTVGADISGAVLGQVRGLLDDPELASKVPDHVRAMVRAMVQAD